MQTRMRMKRLLSHNRARETLVTVATILPGNRAGRKWC